MPVFSHGFQFGLAYTCGRTLGAAGADGDFGRVDNLNAVRQLQNDRRNRPPSHDRRKLHLRSARDVREARDSPFAHGWAVSWLTRFQSGAAFSVPNIGNQQLEGS